MIDKNGFIKGAIQNWSEEHRNRYAELFAQSEELNRECHSFLSERSVAPRNTLEITSFALFLRIMELYQALFVLCERGMPSASRVLFRAFLEAYFYLAAITIDEEILELYLNQLHITRLNLVKRIHKAEAQTLQDLQEQLSPELLSEIEQTIRKGGLRFLSTREVAQKAGLDSIYVTAYAVLSGAVHSTAYDLESQVEFDDTSGAIQQFKCKRSQGG